MQTINQESLLNRLSELKQPNKKNRLTTRHQVEGVEVAKKLGAKKSSEFSHVIKCFKVAPNIAQSAYSYISDYPNARNSLALFFWRYYALKRERG